MRVSLYLDRDTFLHRRHPQVKLGLLVAAFFGAFLVDDPLAVLPVAAAVGVLLWGAGALPNVARLRVLFVMVPGVTFLVWTFFYRQGEPLPALGPLGVSGEALRYAAGMALKLETFLASSILFLSVARVEEFTEALRGVGLPDRVSFVIGLSFRLLPLFLSSAFAVVDAQRARGLDFSARGIGERLRLYVPVIVPVFMGALRRADAMAIALEARGFGSRRARTVFERSRFGASDLAAAAALAAVAGGYLWAWLHGYGKVG